MKITSMLKQKYKNLNRVTKAIIKSNPMQKNRIIKLFDSMNNDYFSYCENLSKKALQLGKFLNRNLEFLANSYNNLCIETVKDQIQFRKCGEYSAILKNSNNLNLYNSNDKMKAYMAGLFLSQIFWHSHYKIIRWFEREVQKLSIKNFLEIGPGHGLLSCLTLKNQKINSLSLCDLSKTSINISKKMLSLEKKIFSLNVHNYDLKKIDKKKYDFIIMGEVIEHVKNPINFLKSTKRLSKDNGKIFISTCANCPAEDHLYRFKNVNHIKSILRKAKLSIKKELVIPSEKIPKKNWEKEKISINYCCIAQFK